MSIMMQDPGVAIGGLIHDRAPDGLIYPNYIRYMKDAHEASGKPVALVASRQGTGSDPLVVDSTHKGLPVIDGVIPFLRGVRGLMSYRDFCGRTAAAPAAVPEKAIRKWRERLAGRSSLDEAASLALLQDFGIEVNPALLAGCEDELQRAADKLGYPLVLKTAMPEMLHKSEHQGVYLHLGDTGQLLDAYRDMKERLGPRVLLAPMVDNGVEMILGARRDPQFGPIVVLGFGGTLAEVIGDVVFALPPFAAEYARCRLNELKLGPLLRGFRSRPAANVDAFCGMAARFSAMVDALRDELDEVDINPVIVGAKHCIAVDALIVSRAGSKGAAQ